MANYTAQMVKELRELTSAGMMDCKNALEECKGELDKAVDWLRQKGLSKAAKKSGRATSEGVVALRVNDNNTCVAMVEVKCETDFVTRGDKFQAFAKSVVETVFNKKPADATALADLTSTSLNEQIAIIGENMTIGRFALWEMSTPGVIGAYIHSNGKIGVLVEIDCTKPETAANPKLMELARNIAMQVAAVSPAALDAASLDPALVEREREVYRQKTIEEGKPADRVEKIVDGRIQKFYKEACLMEQGYIRDDKVSIKDLVAAEAKALNDTLTVKRFVRLQLGEDASA
ncbi:translation elongation factor Ts [Desulfovibrio litoralis]|uniref:Elongation factor Ts n=1 Tax=Desulfovibrio litoralis DSM 11393 TaxID=1121455 RepID=A0A1M7SC75_9BACT|nr:translation elongation factor Ts [Desulfovibrio litoralis]SHN56056.1 translation elongation factor Ts (EF-Ts) [Desulfovibrio litoralis DSM 11393]